MKKPQSTSMSPSPSDVLTAYETLYTAGQIKPRDMIKEAIQFLTGEEIGPDSFLHRRLVDMIKRAWEKQDISESTAISSINQVFDLLPNNIRTFEIAARINLDVIDTRARYESGTLSGEGTLGELTATFSNFSRPGCLAECPDIAEKTKTLIDALLTNHPRMMPHFRKDALHRRQDAPVVRLAQKLVAAFNQEVKARTFHAIPSGHVYLPQRRIAVGPNGYLVCNLEHDPFEDWAAIPA